MEGKLYYYFTQDNVSLGNNDLHLYPYHRQEKSESENNTPISQQFGQTVVKDQKNIRELVIDCLNF